MINQFENQLKDGTGVFVDPISKTLPVSLRPVLSSFHINILDDPDIYTSSYIRDDFSQDGIMVEGELEDLEKAYYVLRQRINQIRHEKQKEYQRIYFKIIRKQKNNYNFKCSVHHKLQRAVNAGKLYKPKRCFICNQKHKRIEGHHEDYNKPLEVIWCCPSCHKKIHTKKLLNFFSEMPIRGYDD